jgi:hypothetical protein
VPFLGPIQITPKTEAEVDADIFTQLHKFSGWLDYDSMKKNKAVDVQYGGCSSGFFSYFYRPGNVTPMIWYWGGAWGKDSIEDAKKTAFVECTKSFQGGKATAEKECTPFLENDDPVPRTNLVRRIIDDCTRTEAEEIQKAKTGFQHSDFTVLLARANRDVNSDGKDLRFHVAQQITRSTNIGYPDSSQDYAAACWGHIYYALIPVKASQQKAILAILNQLSRSSYYGKYSRTVNTSLDYRDRQTTTPDYPGGPDQLTTLMAHFVEFGRITSNNSPELPRNLREALARERLHKLWLEGSVRISRSGLPLSIDEKKALLAIQTNKALYLGVEVRPPRETSGCNVAYPLKGEVLDYSICGNDAACKVNAVNAMLQSVKSALQEPPVAARPMLDEPLGPGEVSLERAYQPSLVLGRPFYELSTYSIHTYTASSDKPFGDAYERTNYMGVGGHGVAQDHPGDPLLLFMYVEHVLTCTPNKNELYGEPEVAQVKKYDQAIQNAVVGGIKDACTKLKGRMRDSVCVMQ